MPSNSEERFPYLTPEREAAATEIAELTLAISGLTDSFSQIDRVPRYSNGRRENDVEHSFMLAIAAPEIADRLGLDLDIDKIRRFAQVHDLLEVKVGDVATFDLTSQQLIEKERVEHQAKQELLDELPLNIADDLAVYEQQDTREAVFVRTVDKLLPVAVDITGQGARVLRDDYGVTSFDALLKSHNALHTRLSEKFGDDFPDLMAVHAALCLIFEEENISAFESRTPQEKTRGPVETERKFIVDLNDVPDTVKLDDLDRSEIHQGYIAIGADGSETRVRSFDDERFELTVKSPGMIQRPEQNIKISEEMFHDLLEQTEGRQVIKTRYYIPHDDLTIELDVYGEDLLGLVTAEVEFDGRQADAKIKANTFEPPEWFGQDVSEDPRYKNHNLAEHKPGQPMELGAKRY